MIKLLFGDLEFFDTLSYSQYLETKYNLSRARIERILLFCVIFLFGITVTQLLMTEILIETLILEILFLFVSLRLMVLFIQQDYRHFVIKAETIGIFVLHELLTVLETSKSLKDATKFIITGNYPIYSELFRKSLLESHYGTPLKDALVFQINSIITGDLQRIFLNIIDTWETGAEVTKHSKNLINSHLFEYIKEETDKIDTWGSLYSGFVFLCPPVIICFLLLSGHLHYIIGFILVAIVLIGSIFFRPDRHLSILTSQSLILPFMDKQTIEFLVIHGENLSAGMSYTRSINESLSIYLRNSKKNLNLSSKESLTAFRLGINDSSSTHLTVLGDLFPSRIIHILKLTEKFSQIDTRLAGLKLHTITEELNRTGRSLQLGKARLKATAMQTTVIQIFSLISLAFISGASPFFQLISRSVVETDLQTNPVLNFDPIYYLLGLIMSILPLTFKFSPEFKTKSIQDIIIRFLRFLLFLIAFMTSRQFLTVSI